MIKRPIYGFSMIAKYSDIYSALSLMLDFKFVFLKRKTHKNNLVDGHEINIQLCCSVLIPAGIHEVTKILFFPQHRFPFPLNDYVQTRPLFFIVHIFLVYI